VFHLMGCGLNSLDCAYYLSLEMPGEFCLGMGSWLESLFVILNLHARFVALLHVSTFLQALLTYGSRQSHIIGAPSRGLGSSFSWKGRGYSIIDWYLRMVS
jgi:hypothetical protein